MRAPDALPSWLTYRDAAASHLAALAACPACARWDDLDPGVATSGTTLPLYAAPYGDDLPWRQDDLLECIRQHSLLVVLGESGAGKTTTLERLMWRTAVTGGPEVPVPVKLRAYRGDLLALFRAALSEPGVLRLAENADLTAFVREVRCWWMLDGLDETPGHLRAQVVGKLADFIRSNPDHRYVITSRRQDGLWPALRDVLGGEVKAVVILPITDRQAQDYLTAWLGSERAAELWAGLDDRLRGAARRPLLLQMIRDAVLSGDMIPENRGELLARFAARTMRRQDTATGPGAASRSERESNGLMALAWHMQRERVLEYDSALAAGTVGRRLGGNPPGEEVISSATTHGLLCGQGAVCFPHQLVQDYFASLELGQRIMKELSPGAATGLARRILGSELLVSLPRQEWWAECYVYLAGLTPRCDHLVRELAVTAPWLAYRCLIEGSEVSHATRQSVEALTVATLQSRASHQRKQAVQELSGIDHPGVERYLVEALGDADRGVGRLALRALAGRWGLPELASLGDSNPDVRQRVVEQMGDLGDPRTVRPLLETLKDGDSRVRLAAVKALARHGDTRVVEALIAMLRDEERTVRLQAAEVLGGTGDERAVMPLIGVLWDEDVGLRRAAAQSLGRIGDARAVESLVMALGDQDGHVRAQAEVALAKIGGAAVEPLMGALRNEDSALRSLAEKTLGEIGEPAIDRLVKALDDDSWEVRVAVVQVLEMIGHERAVEVLTRALRDGDDGVRSMAVVALQRIGDARAVVPLVETLRDSSDFVRVGAAVALGRICDALAVQPLIENLRDQSWVMRRAATDALGRIRDSRAVEPLIAVLQDEDIHVRATAAAALGRIGDTRAVEPLIEILRTGDYASRRTAGAALRVMGTERALEAAEEYEKGQRALRNMDPGS